MLSIKDIMDKNKIITLWGILDIAVFAWYIAMQLFHRHIPFYYDITTYIQMDRNFGTPLWSLWNIGSIVSLFLFISLLFSGFYLIKHKRLGAILSYIQTPFRLLTFIPPSIFFITWPLKYIFDSESIQASILKDSFEPMTIFALSTVPILVILSESLKLYSVITWRKKMKIA